MVLVVVLGVLAWVVVGLLVALGVGGVFARHHAVLAEVPEPAAAPTVARELHLRAS